MKCVAQIPLPVEAPAVEEETTEPEVIGRTPITLFDPSGYPTRFGGGGPGFPADSYWDFAIAVPFILTQYEGFRRNGTGTYLKSFAPPGLPLKPLMVPFMWGIEVLGEFTKPLTLGMRLYANILAGHLIIYVFLGLILYFGTVVAIISVPLSVVFYAFEVFVAILQAYIFAILTQVYIELAMFREDH